MKNFKDKIGSKYTPKHTIKKKFLGEACPRTPLAKRMASPATCKFPNLKKKILGPPPAKSWGRPCLYNSNYTVEQHHIDAPDDHKQFKPLLSSLDLRMGGYTYMY